MIEPHEAVGRLVTTTATQEGVRWACDVCNETVFLTNSGDYRHFRKDLNTNQSNLRPQQTPP